MRQLPLVILIVAAVNPLLAAAPTGDQRMQDYYLGLAVGECFALGCQIFRGVLPTDPPRSGDTVSVRVVELLLGPPIADDAVAVPYQDPARPGKYQTVVASAWGRVQSAANLPVVVALATSEGYGWRRGDPVVVTATDHEAEVTRVIVGDALVLQDAPERVSDLVASLPQSASPGVSGFLRVYLNRHNFHSAEPAAGLLLQMVEDSDVPGSQVRTVLVDAVERYFYLPPPAKAPFVRRLARLGLSAEADVAAAAFEQLGRVATFDDSLSGMLPPDTIGQLRGAYGALLKSGKIKRNEPLEAAIGMKPQR